MADIVVTEGYDGPQPTDARGGPHHRVRRQRAAAMLSFGDAPLFTPARDDVTGGGTMWRRAE